MVAQNIAKQKNHRFQAHVNANGGSAITRVHNFFSMNPLVFLQSQTNENAQNFLDEIKNIFEVIQVTWNDRVEFESYHLKDVAHIRYTQWKEKRGTDETPIT